MLVLIFSFNTYNESQFVNSESEKIKFIDFDSDLEGIEYTKMVQKAKSQYNLENKQIADNSSIYYYIY